jgi:hypothetical protein
VALLAPLAIHVWHLPGSGARRAGRLALALPAATWGLAAYMIYQAAAFGDPLAFAEAQSQWRVRAEAPLAAKLWSLATLEPVWGAYVPGREAFWAELELHGSPWFSLMFANPAMFVLAAALAAWGWRRGWLDGREAALVAGLLLVPYLTRAYEMGMASMGRFVAVAFPVYLVLGRALARLPAPVAAMALALSAVMLFVFAAMFSAGFRVF